MKSKNIVTGGLVLGIGIISSVQLFASCNVSEQYKTNTVYSVLTNTKAASIESEFKSLFFDALKNYADIDASEFPADAVFTVVSRDRKTINEAADKSLRQAKQNYDKKEISEKEYKMLTHNAEKTKTETFGEITCTISLLPPDEEIFSQDYEYRALFNAETKELLLLDIPTSQEGKNLLFDEKEPTISVKSLSAKYANLIQKHSIGGIKTPIDITPKDANGSTNFPGLVFQDKDDATKKVSIGLDGANGNLAYIYVYRALDFD